MMARTLKAILNKANLKEKVKLCMNILTNLRETSDEPQHALPDIFIWMVQNNKRVAYHRIPAKDVVYSVVDEERGRECGKVQTFFLKVFSRLRRQK